MKKISLLPVLILVSVLTLSGCASIPLADLIDLSLEASPTEVVLGQANQYHQTVEMKWKITNNSEQILTSEEYEFALMSARAGETSSTLLKTLELTIEPNSEEEGAYDYFIDGIGVEGEFEFQWIVYEKIGDSFREIKKAIVPYMLNWESKE